MDRLRRIAAAIAAGEISAPGALGPELAWLADHIARYEAGASGGVTMDQALGLVPRPGQRQWWTSERLRQRDEGLREVRAARFPDLGIASAARGILALCPRRATGRPSTPHPLAGVIGTGAPLPSARRLRAILAAGGRELPPIAGQPPDAP